VATEVVNYQCPACTGPLHFAGASGKLECEYCGSSFEVEDIQQLYAKKEEYAVLEAEEAQETVKEWDESDLSQDWGEDSAQMRSYTCPSCGAQLICEETTAATSCPYCGNPTVVPERFSGALRPDYVIPFKVTKERAIEALKAHYKGKFLLPKLFTSEQQLQKIQGIYVPFWLFDGEASGNCNFHATRVHTKSTQKETITVTEHFQVYRSGRLSFEKVPVDASTKMPDGHMDAIEPYDYQELKPFSTAYLPGFLADKYDVEVADCQGRADERCENTLAQALQDTVTMYNTCTLERKNIRVHRGKVHYALLPVWLLHVKWKDQGYLFAVNGQSGKLVGQLPVSKERLIALFLSVFLGIGTVGTLLVQLLG